MQPLLFEIMVIYRILITGSKGLIGLTQRSLELLYIDVVGIDKRFESVHPDYGDILNTDTLFPAVEQVDGIVPFSCSVKGHRWREKSTIMLGNKCRRDEKYCGMCPSFQEKALDPLCKQPRGLWSPANAVIKAPTPFASRSSRLRACPRNNSATVWCCKLDGRQAATCSFSPARCVLQTEGRQRAADRFRPAPFASSIGNCKYCCAFA